MTSPRSPAFAHSGEPVDTAPVARARGVGLLLLAAVALIICGLLALGTWQLERLEWKRALIERVESRAYAAPAPLPDASAWDELSREKDEYRRVTTRGRYLHDSETLVWAVTGRGPGYWLLTPLVTAGGKVLLVNRGYLPAELAEPARRAAARPAGVVEVSGLLRFSEPGGGPLRANDPAAERWYSRDIEAIAGARGLDRVAPFFIDADDAANPGGYPLGGLTRLVFRNAHLAYALTWYGLALLIAALTLRAIWLERRR